MKPKLIIFALAPLVLSGGCATESLFFATKSSIGIDVSATNGAPRFNIGYDRSEFAIVPTKANGDAHSVLGGIDADLSLNNVRIKELFATGEAAKLAAGKNTGKALATDDKSAPGSRKKLGQPIIFAADASLGLLNIQIESNGMPGFGSLFYRRSEATLIPVKPEQDDVASVYADISIDTSSKDENKPDSGKSWIEKEVGQHPTRFPGFGVRIVQSFATGTAAASLAQESDVKKKLMKAGLTKDDAIEGTAPAK